MKIISVIPARYAATRFHGKLMKKIGDKSVILTTYENTKKTNLFDEVFVITDSRIIYDEIIKHGGKVKISKKNHETGSDRIAEVVKNMNCDLIINVQGDEPFVEKKSLKKIIKTLIKDSTIDVVSLMKKNTNLKQIKNSNYVKVVIDKNFNALYFSRSIIPFPRNKDLEITYYEHIGIYGFKKKSILDFYNKKMLQNELIEKIECLRYLEHGMKIKMLLTDYKSIEIDTEEDLIRANNLLKQKSKFSK